MTSVNDDVVLRKVGEPEPKKLPVGIHMITFDDHIIFVRRIAGRFMPVSPKEQEELCQQFLR